MKLQKNKSSYLQFNSFIRKNLILLFFSIFKSFRTYVYVFILPTLLLLGMFAYQTYGGINKIEPPVVAGLILIPGFWIAILINTLISEWKNSIFLKRISVLGTSKFEFLLVIWLIGIILGIVSIIFALGILLALMPVINFAPTNSVLETFEFMSYGSAGQIIKAWGCFILGGIVVIISSIGIGTLLSGALKSLALTQSLTIVIIFACIVMSDLLLGPSMFCQAKPVIYIGYFFPQRYGAWIVFYGVSDGNVDYFINNPQAINTYLSFENLLGPIFGGLGYTCVLLGSSYLCFGWNSRG